MNNVANNPCGKVLDSLLRMASEDAGDADSELARPSRHRSVSYTLVCPPQGGINSQTDNAADSVSSEARP